MVRTTLIAVFISSQAWSAAWAQTPSKQAVLDTSAGTIVMDLLADKAPNHVALFIKTAESGGYNGTTFFRMVRRGLIQGGDPVTKDPAARAKYGSGGLNLVKPEMTGEKHTRGAVSTVEIPGRPDSGGTQFFVCVSDQAALDGKYTVFARVVEGMFTAQAISETAVDAEGLAIERVVVTTVTIRDTGGTDHQSFDAVGLPGFQFIQDEVEYDTRTHHSNADVYERIQKQDMMNNAVIVAAFVYNTANRDEKLPKKPLPKPTPPAGRGTAAQH